MKTINRIGLVGLLMMVMAVPAWGHGNIDLDRQLNPVDRIYVDRSYEDVWVSIRELDEGVASVAFATVSPGAPCGLFRCGILLGVWSCPALVDT